MASVASTPSRLEREQREESEEKEDAKHAAKRERVDATAAGDRTCANWVRAAYFGLFDDDDDQYDDDQARWPVRAVPHVPHITGRWVDVTSLVCRADAGRATTLSQVATPEENETFPDPAPGRSKQILIVTNGGDSTGTPFASVEHGWAWSKTYFVVGLVEDVVMASFQYKFDEE